MAQPSSTDVFVSIPLTTLSVAFIQRATDFVAGQVFPTVPSERQGAQYAYYPKEAWFRNQAKPRGPGDESAGTGFGLQYKSYFIPTPLAIHKDIDDQTLANQMSPVNLQADATRNVTQLLLLAREVLWQTGFFKTGIWTGSATGSDITPSPTWGAAGSTPIEDVYAQKLSVKQQTGYMPNVFVITPDVFAALIENAEIVERIKYGGSAASPAVANEQSLAAVFGVDKVLVAWGTNVTSQELVTPDTWSWIAGTKKALLAYAAPEPGILTPSAGYHFAWTGYVGAGAEGNRIKSFRLEQLESERVEGTLATMPVQIAPEMGAFFTAAV
jgi:hypothetical protein